MHTSPAVQLHLHHLASRPQAGGSPASAAGALSANECRALRAETSVAVAFLRSRGDSPDGLLPEMVRGREDGDAPVLAMASEPALRSIALVYLKV